jgi:Uma2 family endonuclease
MTTLPLPPLPLAPEDGWTVADLVGLPPTLRYEVHNGKLVIMSPTRLWHQEIERRICNLLVAAQRFAYTQVGVRRTARDARVAEVGVFHEAPTDSSVTWHDPGKLALVIEVWSESSDEKDRDASWYADCGIPEYWLAEPIEGETWGALITVHKLARTTSGEATYIKTDQTTLAELEKSGLPA